MMYRQYITIGNKMSLNIDRVAFRIFGIEIMWYGILISIGVYVGILVAQHLAKSDNMDPEKVLDIVLYSLPIGVVGARIYYIIFQWEYYAGNLRKMLDIRQGGLAIYGGIIAGCFTAYVYCKIRKLKFLKIIDIFMPAIAVGQAIGRWGNFINQEAYGRPTDLPWAILIEGQKVHPTFLYESIGDFMICIFLCYYFKHRKQEDGEVFSLYLILYGLLRSLVEGLRTDSLYLGAFRVSQLLSVVLIAIGIVMFYTLKKRWSKDIRKKHNKKKYKMKK